MLRPVVYISALTSVFLLLVSSIDLDVPLFKREIIDAVSKVEDPVLQKLLFRKIELLYTLLYILIYIYILC